MLVPFLPALQFSRNFSFSSRCDVLSGMSSVNKNTGSSEKVEHRKVTGLISKDRLSGQDWVGVFFTNVKNITKDTTMGQDQEGKGLSTLGSLFRVSMLVESSLLPIAFPLSPTPLPCFMFFHFIHYCITYLFTLSIVCVLKKLCNLHKGRAVCVCVHSCSLLHSYYLAGYTPESMFSSLDMWCRSAGGSRRLGKLMWHRLKTNLREMER